MKRRAFAAGRRFQHDVEPSDQVRKERGTVVAIISQRNASLIPVEALPSQAPLEPWDVIYERLKPAASGTFGWFDRDHVGAEIGQI